MTEMTVGVRELKSQLSKYLRHVKSGRTILITERGKTVGRIMPPEAPLEEKLEAMRRAGLLRWNGRRLKPMRPIARLRHGKSIADLVSENRE
jgi:prevent-host-death family protein